MNKPEFMYETFIRATPEKIWEALTTAAFTSLYFHGTHVDSDWKTGSPVVFRGDDGTPLVEGEVLVADRPKRLSYTWHVLYDDELTKERPSRVTFELEPLPGVCRLRIVHDDFDVGSKTLEKVSQGWSSIICSLKTLLETGDALPLAGNEEKGAA